jgi:hypothetical protein
MALCAAALATALGMAGPAFAEEPSVTPPAGPAGLTTPSAEAPADATIDQPGPSASQAQRDNVRGSLPGPHGDGGISGGLLAACLIAVVGGVVAATSGAQRRRAAL